LFTVTWQDALKFVPSVVVALIVAVPTPTEVTFPLLSTVATEGLLLVQLSTEFVASLGVIVAISCAVSGNVSVRLFSLRAIDVTLFTTVTWHDAVKLVPSVVFAIMVALPGATGVTRPLLDTVTMAGLLDIHVTVLLVALLGETVAISW
jgi:hypothetical protein